MPPAATSTPSPPAGHVDVAVMMCDLFLMLGEELSGMRVAPGK